MALHTYNAAMVTFEEDIKGSIEQGKLADLAVLSDNLLTIDRQNIKDISVLMTVVEGKIVCQAKDF